MQLRVSKCGQEEEEEEEEKMTGKNEAVLEDRVHLFTGSSSR